MRYIILAPKENGNEKVVKAYNTKCSICKNRCCIFHEKMQKCKKESCFSVNLVKKHQNNRMIRKKTAFIKWVFDGKNNMCDGKLAKRRAVFNIQMTLFCK